MSYRVEFGGGAQVQFHSLPEYARDTLANCAVELAGQPWDAVVRPPGVDPRFREAVFGSGSGIVGFYLDEAAQLIRIFGIVWIGGEPEDIEVFDVVLSFRRAARQRLLEPRVRINWRAAGLSFDRRPATQCPP